MGAALGGEVPRHLAQQLVQGSEHAVDDLGERGEDEGQVGGQQVDEQHRPRGEGGGRGVGRPIAAGDDHQQEEQDRDVGARGQLPGSPDQPPAEEQGHQAGDGGEREGVARRRPQGRPREREVGLPERDVADIEERHQQDAGVEGQRGHRLQRPAAARGQQPVPGGGEHVSQRDVLVRGPPVGLPDHPECVGEVAIKPQ